MTQQTSNPSLLKDTRETKGLTLEIVHEATKIPLDALKAIEQGYSTRVLTPFYYRGFVKIYAEFLGLDVKEVFRAYNIEKPQVKIAQATASVEVTNSAAVRPKPFKPKVPWTTQANPVLERLGGMAGKIFSPQNRGLLLKLAVAAAAVALVIKVGGYLAASVKSKPSKSKAASHPAAVKREKAPSAAAVSPAPAPAPIARPEVQQKAEKASAPASILRKVQLVLRATRNSWIQVRADGKVVFSMSMRKGTVETWEASNEIEVAGRNLGDLQWEVNGQELGTLSAGQRRARRVVITKEGLSVKK